MVRPLWMSYCCRQGMMKRDNVISHQQQHRNQEWYHCIRSLQQLIYVRLNQAASKVYLRCLQKLRRLEPHRSQVGLGSLCTFVVSVGKVVDDRSITNMLLWTSRFSQSTQTIAFEVFQWKHAGTQLEHAG